MASSSFSLNDVVEAQKAKNAVTDDLSSIMNSTSFTSSRRPSNGKGGSRGRLAEFKAKRSSTDETARRERFLANQKSKRFDRIMSLRGLTEEDQSEPATQQPQQQQELTFIDATLPVANVEDVYDANTIDDSEDSGSKSQKSVNKNNQNRQDKKNANHKNKPRPQKDALMLSEWLKEIPEKFDTDWCFVVCPKAKRCLIVAAKGVTTAFARNGKRIRQFPSALPGGCRNQRVSAQTYTILDCLIHEQTKSIYVLDVMAWRGHEVVDSELTFRTYWMHTKIEEEPELSDRTSTNPYSIVPLNFHDCTPELVVQSVATQYPFEIDGFLFYHKSCHYVAGTTPLALWLKPDMLAPTLGIEVPEFPAPLLPTSVMAAVMFAPDVHNNTTDEFGIY